MSIVRIKRKLRKLHKNKAFKKLYYAIGKIKHAMFRGMSDEKYLKLIHKENTGKALDLENPKSYNEKLQWIKLYDRKPEYTVYADKYAVRDFIAKKIGEQYLVKLYGIYDSFDEINFDSLPNQFVLKCTHDSGSVYICRDKSKMDLKKQKKYFTQKLKSKSYYYYTREWPYKNIRHRLVAEEFLSEGNNDEGLKDYKIFCFNGEPKYIQVHYDREVAHKTNVYDTEWVFQNLRFSNYPSDPDANIPKPEKLDEMLRIARVLSEGIPHIRIDLYYVNNRIYFGEMTFFHAAGFAEIDPPEFSLVLGDMIELPKAGDI